MIFRSEQWLAAVRSIGRCVLCGKPNVQAAHRNEGKGLSIKVDDCASACLCAECHFDIDQGPHLTRDERRSRMDKAIVLTVIELVRRGLISTVIGKPLETSRPKVRAKVYRTKGRTSAPSKILAHSGRLD